MVSRLLPSKKDQLEYDPSKDSDNRSVMSGTTLGGMSMARGGVGVGTPGGVADPHGDYFKNQYSNYMAGGPMHGGEEFEMSNVAARDSRDNLLEKRQNSLYNESLDGTLAGTTYGGGKSSPEAGMGAHGQYGYSMASTPGLESGIVQQVNYADPYAHNGQAYGSRMGANPSAQASQTSLGSYGNLLYGGNGPAVAAGGYGVPSSQSAYGSGRTTPGAAQQISPGTVIAPTATQYHAGGYTASPPNHNQAPRYTGAPMQRQASADYLTILPVATVRPNKHQLTNSMHRHTRHSNIRTGNSQAVVATILPRMARNPALDSSSSSEVGHTATSAELFCARSG